MKSKGKSRVLVTGGSEFHILLKHNGANLTLFIRVCLDKNKKKKQIDLSQRIERNITLDDVIRFLRSKKIVLKTLNNFSSLEEKEEEIKQLRDENNKLKRS